MDMIDIGIAKALAGEAAGEAAAGKLDGNQGAANAGKIMGIDNSGNVVPVPGSQGGTPSAGDIPYSDQAAYDDGSVGKAVTQLKSVIADISENCVWDNTTYSPEFEQGTISSSYKETDNAKRIRTVDAIDVSTFVSAQCDSNHVIWQAEFDAAMTGVNLITSGSRRLVTANDFQTTTKYVRFILVNNNSATEITPSSDYTFVVETKAPPKVDAVVAKVETSFPDINMIDPDDWELGGIDEHGFSQVIYRIRTASLYHVKAGDYLTFNVPASITGTNKYNIAFYTNDVATSFSGWLADAKYVFESEAYIRIWVGASGSYDPVNWDLKNCIALISPSYTGSIVRRTADVNSVAKSLLHRRQNLGLPFTYKNQYTFGVSLSCDILFVGDDLWTFSASEDDHSNLVSYYVYTYDPNTDTFVSKRNAQHNLGHINSIDYCAGNDCIICGNGSGSYVLANAFYVVPGASEITGNIDVTDNVIVYDCSALNLGAKLNVIWGDDNGGQFDCCWGITDDNAHIYRIILGRGENELTYGTLIPGKSDNEFNGTFAIAETYSQSTCGYETCVQGSTYWRGSIYAGIGHNVGGIRVWKMTPQRDGTIMTEEHTQPIYTQELTKTGDVGGITVWNDEVVFIARGGGKLSAYYCK